MPCHDDRDSYESRCGEQSKEIKELEQRNDKLARMLCGLCSRIEALCEANKVEADYGSDRPIREALSMLIPDGMELKHWWIEHKKFDAKRRKEEHARGIAKIQAYRAELVKKARIKAALDKLTPEEKELLGIPKGL